MDETSSMYILEIYEAIKQFTASYVDYSVLGRKSQKTVLDENERQAMSDTLTKLPYYEEHAHIRLLAIAPTLKIDLTKIDEQRKELLQPEKDMPNREKLEKLVVEYHKVTSTQMFRNVISSASKKVDELAGKM